jgi:methionyl-tRNA formyltransferase
MAGDEESGVAIMQMEAGLDTGPVLLEKKLRLAADETAASLHDRLAALGGEAICAALEKAESLSATPQVPDGISYAEKIDKSEAKLDFTRSAIELDRHIRGLSPFPGAWFELAGARVKVLKARPLDLNGTAGQGAPEGAVIYCGQGALELLQVQKAGKAAVTGDEFMRGHALIAGQEL